MSNPVVVGYVSGAPVTADVTSPGLASIVNVTLSADYQAINPPGYPARPPAGSAKAWFPQILAAGTSHLFFACEANAIIAAGARVAA